MHADRYLYYTMAIQPYLEHTPLLWSKKFRFHKVESIQSDVWVLNQLWSNRHKKCIEEGDLNFVRSHQLPLLLSVGNVTFRLIIVLHANEH